MSNNSPILIDTSKTAHELARVPLTGSESEYDERFIQELAFNHPACLPIRSIDSDYRNMVPLCMELNTPAGPIDALYVTSSGKLVILEAKLWRNPEARRKVIGQILDYAKELTSWSYDDLQREVQRRVDLPNKSLYAFVLAKFPDVDEVEFIDGITRSLQSGRFLLLVLGDGIREGAASIASFLQSFGRLDFSFGLIELGLFKLPNGELLVQPQVLAKTLVVERHVMEVRKDGSVTDVEEPEEQDKALTEGQRFYEGFWAEWLSELDFDDASQPVPSKTTTSGAIYFSLPPSMNTAWITTFFVQKEGRTGSFLTFAKGQFGNEAYQTLLRDRELIDRETKFDLEWESDGEKHRVLVSKKFDSLTSAANRSEIKAFLSQTANELVNTFRPRLERISRRDQ